MAKLGARGRTEVFRASKETPGGSDGNLDIERTRNEVAFMSDRTILAKTTVYYKAGGSHNWGWKVVGRLKREVSLETAKEARRAAGYTITTGGAN